MKRYIYAIYPTDDNGHATSVYVGISNDVEQRVRSHRSSQSNPRVRDAMKNGFVYQILDEVEEEDSRLEYDYIDFFRNAMDLPVLNAITSAFSDYKRVLPRLISKFTFYDMK